MTGDGPVSRETPPVPASAQGVFAARTSLAVTYAELLATDGVTRGLIGPRETPRLWERHLLNCAVLADVLGEGTDVCDLGSGAGLPGVVLAIRRPDLTVTLVEPLLRRTTFLSEVVDRLALGNVDVVRARAEDLHGDREFTVVTSRALAPLRRLVQWSMPLVRQGGQLLAMKGASAADEVESASEELRRWGVGAVDVLALGAGVIDPQATVIRVESTRPSALGLSESGRRGAKPVGRGSRRQGRSRDADPERAGRARARRPPDAAR
jgi:16S rRNA (guanine527-N7)-methyltransferase